MRRYRFTGPIGGLALAVTMMVGCADGPATTMPQPVLAVSGPSPEPPPPVGRCPEGFDLRRIETLPADRQGEARFKDTGLSPGGGPLGNNDGYVCLGKPRSTDGKRPIIDNHLPLDE